MSLHELLFHDSMYVEFRMVHAITNCNKMVLLGMMDVKQQQCASMVGSWYVGEVRVTSRVDN